MLPVLWSWMFIMVAHSWCINACIVHESKSKTIVLIIDYCSKLSVGHQVLMGWDKTTEPYALVWTRNGVVSSSVGQPPCWFRRSDSVMKCWLEWTYRPTHVRLRTGEQRVLPVIKLVINVHLSYVNCRHRVRRCRNCTKSGDHQAGQLTR